MSVKLKQKLKSVANLENRFRSYFQVRKCYVSGEPRCRSFGQILFYYREKCKLLNAAENVDKTDDF